MPKKTKEQKQRSDSRRFRHKDRSVTGENTVSYSLLPTPIPDPTKRVTEGPALSAVEGINLAHVIPQEIRQTAVIRRDLVKILLLAASALSFEFFLYWMWVLR